MIWLKNLKTKLYWLDSYCNAKTDRCFLQVDLNINPLKEQVDQYVTVKARFRVSS